MKAIKLLHVLLEYDYPQVFVGIDAVGGKYVCMVFQVENDEPSFLCVPVSERRCSDLYNSKIDLRSVYEFPELSEFYEATPCDLTEPFEIKYLTSVAPDEILPEPSLVFTMGDEVLNKAQELNSTVAYASLSVPESVK